MYIVGDAHGKLGLMQQKLLRLDMSKPVVHLGDLGFDYSQLHLMPGNPFRFFSGNHDNFNTYHECKYALGDFGPITLTDHNMFFVRGGLSIDKKYRTIGHDWFAEEELTYTQMDECFDLYIKQKPDIVLSHECPQSVIPMVSQFSDQYITENFGCTLPSRTSVFLERLFEAHQPKFWCFGHFHRSKDFVYKTHFKCLAELEIFDLDTL
jgi:predicted phosphodiesterase